MKKILFYIYILLSTGIAIIIPEFYLSDLDFGDNLFRCWFISFNMSILFIKPKIEQTQKYK